MCAALRRISPVRRVTGFAAGARPNEVSRVQQGLFPLELRQGRLERGDEGGIFDVVHEDVQPARWKPRDDGEECVVIGLALQGTSDSRDDARALLRGNRLIDNDARGHADSVALTPARSGRDERDGLSRGLGWRHWRSGARRYGQRKLSTPRAGT